MLSSTDITERTARLSAAKRILLEKRLRGERSGNRPAQVIRSRAREGVAVLSFAQQRLWFIDQLEGGSSFYNNPVAVLINGPLRPEVLEQTLSEIIRRHEILRTCFAEVDGNPLQIISPPAPLQIPIIDLSELAEVERGPATVQLAVEEAARPFNVSTGPLLRVQLIRLSESEHVVLLTLHHIVTDRWSTGVLIKEVATIYEAFRQGHASPLAELEIQYADYAAWQREWLQGEVLEEQLRYWSTQLGGELPVTEFPFDRARPAVQRFRGERCAMKLPAHLVESLTSLSRQEGATLFMTLLAAFQILLYRYTQQHDVLVGTAIANRNRRETEELIGFFANTLVLRTNLSGQPTIAEVLRRVREVCLGAYAHQDLPFEKLVEELQPMRDLSRLPLIQNMLILQNQPMEKVTLKDLTFTPLDVSYESAQLDLLLNLVESPEGLTGAWIYNTDLFDAATIERMVGHFQHLLEGMVANTEQKITSMPLLRREERQQMIVDWNNTGAEYDRARCLHELFEAAAARRPEAVAVCYEGEQLSYGELNRRANQVAHYLVRLGMGAGELVSICVERSLEMVIGMLGILKAGGAYVPLEPGYPPQRLGFMLADAAARVLLTQRHLAAQLPATGAEVVYLDEIGEESAANPGRLTQPENLAYVIYTSGSSGQPKGVMVSHGAVVHLLAELEVRLGLAEGDVWSVFHSYGFDFSVWELWGGLSSGGRLVLVPRELTYEPEALNELLRSEAVSVLSLTPAALGQLVGVKQQAESVRVVICGGEAFPRPLAAQMQEWSVPVWNFYGPTEATVWSVVQEVRAEELVQQSIGIGRPIANTQAYVLDEHGEPVAVGVAGELYLGGEGLARGYLKRPELTAEKFVANPFSRTPGARLYRTGDLVRYRRTGELEYLGRLDQQVKLRGYRIELGEIEAALLSEAGVRECVVVARNEGDGEQRLIGYVVAESEWEQRELREHLRQGLPEYMIPSVFVRLEELPLTANGKLDRRALPAPAEEVRRDSDLASGLTAVEEVLVGIWQEVLRVKAVGVQDNFFELGGHSLLATQLLSRVRAAFGVELGLRKLFEAPTVAGLAAEVEQLLQQGAGVAAPPLRRALRAGPLPLSFAQQGLWFIDQLEGGSSFYNVPVVVALSGELEVQVLERTLTEVVRRHEVLRTHFAEVDGEPVQVIGPPGALHLPVLDLRDLPAAEREAEARRLAQVEAAKAFDLSTGPLLRVQLLRLAETEHVVLLTLHHIITDGWSTGVLIKEVATLYAAFTAGQGSPLAELELQYGDYAVWQREWLQGEVLEQQLGYWRRQLSGELPLLELPTDRPRPAVQSYRGASFTVSLSGSLTEALQELSRREGVTLFMTLLAAFQTLLYRYSGQEDVLVGTPMAGRGLRMSEETIGYFANTLVLRTAVQSDLNFRELLRQVREVALEAYAHQEMPFEKVVEAVQPKRELSHHPLFQVLFALHNLPAQEIALPELKLSWVEADQVTARFDLALDLRKSAAGIKGKLEYSTDLFDAETIERLWAHYENLLTNVVATPEQRLGEVSLLSTAECEQLLVGWNATDAEYGREQCLPELIEEQVRRSAGSVALVFGEEEVSYAELNRRANQLAHYLRQHGVGPEVLVGVLLERSVEVMVAVLGVLKAGGAYVPLEPSYPKQRLAFMLADTEARVLLTQRHLVAELPETEAQIVCLDEDWEQIGEQSEANPVRLTEPENLAYVIYTSGSTGKPKGVQITHRGILNFLAAMGRQPGLSASDVFLSVTSLSFDIAGLELFLPLLKGARVVVASREEVVDGSLLMARLETSGATVMQATPATWRLLLEAGWQGDKRLQVLCGGEALGAKLAEQLGTRSRELWNLYGPTETTIWSTISKVESGSPVTIGRPIANTQCYVLDQHGQPAPIGVAGELYIGGDGLARGYWQRPELTAEKFVVNPFSRTAGARLYRTGDVVRYRRTGELEYLGRLDQQVKLRGYRIELGEIEAALLSETGVRECVVVARHERDGEQRLVGYVVADSEWEQREMREHLRQRLPEYMIPSVFVKLEELPLTANGKLDRRALPAPAEEVSRGSELASGLTAVEEVLLGIWQEVLRVQAVGVTDNFFELGGHSLLGTRLLSRVRAAFGVELGLRKLFEAPTVAGLAAEVEQLLQQGAGVAAPPLRRALRAGPLPLSFAQQRLWFIDRLEGGSSFYNLPVAVALSGELQVEALERTLTEVVQRHEVLRTHFAEVDGEPVQVIEAAVAVRLAVRDLSELPAAEREAEVQRLAQVEAAKAFDLSTGPMLRVQLLRLAETEHVVLLTLHHIITDGWSTGVLIKEVAMLYAAFTAGQGSPLPELEWQYSDYAAWQREWLQGEVLEQQVSYWRRQLGGELPVLELPTDRPRPAVQSYRGASFTVSLSRSVTEALQELSRREGVTLFMTLLAAFQTLLYRYSGQADVLVGTPIAGRGQRKSEEVIGYFANTLVLRTRLRGELSFRELMREVREVCLEAYVHQETPFEKVVEALQPKRELSHHPLFQVLFALHNLPVQELASQGLELSWRESEQRTSRFDLALELRAGGKGLRGKLEYSRDLFDEERVRKLWAHYEQLLLSVAAAPERRLSELELLSEGERRQLLYEWNATDSDYARGQCLHELFEAAAARRSEAVAVCYEGEELSYGELNRRANQVAHHLVRLGVGAGELVSICVERSLEMVIGMLGILKAGGAYVPLEPGYPPQRLAFMVADAAARVLLTQRHLAAQLPATGAQLVYLDEIGEESAANPERLTEPENLAYVIYTSGSSGQPKGVMVSHGAVVHLLAGLGVRLGIAADDVWSVFHSYGFDFSVWELWGGLSSGGRLVLVPRELMYEPEALNELLRSEAVSVLSLTPAALGQLVGVKQQAESVRVVICGGEAFPRLLAAQMQEWSVPVWNFYGPTEATVWSVVQEVRAAELEQQSIGIGRPIANTQCYVLDEHGEPVAVGVAGELYLGGEGLARGYLKRPELTAEKFVANPFSSTAGARLYRTGDVVRYRRTGELEYLGRLDQQVKLRGYRIELGEIEAALLSHAAVNECAVIARREGDGEQRLVGYVVAESEWEQRELREHLRQRLPEYMIPSVFVRLEELPLTANGKLDRRALPAPEVTEERRETDTGSVVTAVEEVLLGIWQEVLRVKAVGVTDNFFELGGHSLLATQLLSRVRAAFGVELGLRKLFEAPTVAGLAAEVEQLLQQGAGVAAPPLRKALRAGPLPLSFAQQRLWFIDRLEGGSSFYNLPAAVALSGELQVAALERTLTEVVRRHEVLRTHFTEVDGEPVQVIEAATALRLAVTDLSELGGAEREAEVQRLAQIEAAKAFDLSTGPLLRVQLLRLAETEHVVLLTLHHIITDGWSTGVLIREVATLYRAYQAGEASPLAELPIQYGDYAAWQREWLQGEALEAQLRYWRGQLGGELPVLELPTDRPRPAVQSYRGRQQSFSLAEDLSRAVKELSRREGVTLFMTLLAGFQTLLYRYTREDDLLIGTAIAGRTQKETEPLLGCFVNTLVLRTDLSGNPKFSKLLRRVREVSLSAYAHQEAPFEKLVEELQPERSLSHTSLFQVAFGVQNTPALALELPGLKLSTVTAPPQLGRFELTVWVVETSSGLRLSWSYNTDLFDESRIERMHRHYETLLQSIVANPETALNALDILTTAERDELYIKDKELANSAYKKFLNTKVKPVNLLKPSLAGTGSPPKGNRKHDS